MATRVKGIEFGLSAKDKTQQAFASAGQRTDKLKGKLKGLGTIAKVAVTAVVAGFTALVANAAKAGDQFDKMSLKIGVGVKALSEYTHVAELSGVEFKTMTKAWQNQIDVVSQAAQGTGEAADALKELGVDVKALNRLPADLQFEKLGDAMAGVESHADKVRIATDLWGARGVALIQVVEQGSDAIRAMRDDAQDLNLTMTAGSAKIGAQVIDAWTRLKGAFTGLGRVILVEVGPALAAVGNWLADRIPKAVRWSVEAFSALKRHAKAALASILDGFAAVAEFMSGAPDFLGAERFAKWAAGARDWASELRALEVDVLPAATGEVGKFTAAVNRAGISTGKVFDSHIRARRRFEDTLESQKTSLITSIETPNESLNRQIALIEKLHATVGLTPEVYQRARDAAVTRYNDEIEALKRAALQVDQVDASADRMGSSLTGAFAGAALEGKGLREVTQGLIDDLARLTLQKAVTEPLSGFLSSGLTGFFGFEMAKGGVTAGGRLRNLPTAARGGRYRTPTVISEHGQPEAAVPLPDGRRIPVALSGGGGGGAVNIDLAVTLNANGGTREQNQDLAERSGREVVGALQRAIDERLRVQLRPGGVLNQSATAAQGF